MKFFPIFRKKKSKKAGQERSGNIKMDRNLVAWNAPNSYEAEQFRILKTKLLFPISGKAARSIMVTSGFRGVGKSFVSANLAVSIAQSIDQHVLLMDCDMRKPSLHKIFGYGDVHGLSDHLANDAQLSELLLKTMLPKLTLFPAGPSPPNPAELLISNKMKNLLDELWERYDDRYIVIDAPPSRIMAETNAIARKIDAVILVVKYGETPSESIVELIDAIGKDKIASVFINQCNSAVDFWGRKKQFYGYSNR